MRIIPRIRYVVNVMLWAILCLPSYIFGQNCMVDGGLIETSASTVICRNDAGTDNFVAQVTNNSGENSNWLVTNNLGDIILISNGPVIELTTAPLGPSRVYHISWENAVGIEVGANINFINGCHNLSNFISIIIEQTNGGVIQDDFGEEARTICLDTPNELTFPLFKAGEAGLSSQWIISDEDGNINQLQNGSTIFLDDNNSSTSVIYHISYASIENLFVGSTLSDLIGCYDLSNPYTVTKILSDNNPGIIGTDAALVSCNGNGKPDVIEINHTDKNNGNNTYIATDVNGFIHRITQHTSIDVEGIESPVVIIRNVAYSDGLIGLEVGKNANNLEGCYRFSNSITINNENVNGGILDGTDGRREFVFCLDDGIQDNINITVTNNIGPNNSLIVVTPSGIIENIISTNIVSFTNTESGVAYVHNIAYGDDILGLEIGQNIGNLQGCFDLSNRLTARKVSGEADAGVITLVGSDNLCTGDPISDIIDFTINSNADNNSIWLFTDANDTIIELPGAPPFDLTNAADGLIKVRYLDYVGIENVAVGKTIQEIEGCYDISNPVEININNVSAGEITYDTPLSVYQACILNNPMVELDIEINNFDGNFQKYALLSMQDTILEVFTEPQLDFSGMSELSYKIVSVSSLEEVSALIPGNTLADLEGCISISNELELELQSTITTPSEISLQSGGFFCLDDNQPRIITVDVLPGVGPSTSWVITDENGLILDVREGGTYDLQQIEGDQNSIYNIKHDPATVGIEAGSFIQNIQGCHSISNSIEIEKGINDGGVLSINGDSEAVICMGEGGVGIEVTLEGATGQSSRFLVTNMDGDVQKISNSTLIDLTGLSAGTYIVWNLSFSSGIRGIGIEDNISELDGCFDFSNAVTLYLEALDGGQILIDNVTTEIDLCGGEGVEDIVNVNLSGSRGSSQTLLITTPSGEILDIPNGNNLNFENAPTGVCYIYNISYARDVDNLQVGTNLSDLNGCYELSNTLTINRNRVAGGDLSFRNEGKFYEGCLTGNLAQALTLDVTGKSANNIFIATKPSGEITKIFQSQILDVQDFPLGQTILYNLSFFAVENLQLGANISGLSGCFDLSNQAILNNIEISAGDISFEGGMTSTGLCVGDNKVDFVDINVNNESAAEFQWIFTDPDGVILSTNLTPPFNLDTEEQTRLFIYYLARQGSVLGLERGQNVADLVGCFDLSNSVFIEKNFVQAVDLLVTDNFKSGRTICIDDNDADIVVVGSAGDVLGDQFRYIVTDEDGIIERITEEPRIEFTGMSEGISNIYQLSYLNGLENLAVGNKISDFSGCYDLSNEVEIIRVGGPDCITSTLSIDGQEVSIDLYPNPASSRIIISMDGLPANKEIQLSIIDLSGKIIHSSFQKSSLNNSWELDITDYPSGMYLLRVAHNTHFQVLRFAVSR